MSILDLQASLYCATGCIKATDFCYVTPQLLIDDISQNNEDLVKDIIIATLEEFKEEGYERLEYSLTDIPYDSKFRDYSKWVDFIKDQRESEVER